jgi:hypothetical protein
MKSVQFTPASEIAHALRTRVIRHLNRWALGLMMASALGGIASAQTGNTLEVKLGETISRTWDQVKAEDYVYGPKQELETETGETHIWLPYGSKAPYYEVSGLHFTEASQDKNGLPLVMSIDGHTKGLLVFKFHFDKPIAAARLFAGWSEWGVKDATVGGIEYSTDGKSWTTIREVNKAGIISTFVPPTTPIDGNLKTSDLYLRFYSRNKGDENGQNYWMKFRMAGNPAWGDASSTFFKQQLQLWVTPTK